ncbi:WSC domain-containing protein [Biomphalaria pfeifferi]|uniref:WSC domain-containing protein n=1 Tax=Biomphalaria pfeifferi TaxID=112525 RepID=A0AAD8BEQ3_BIOPF|nr:WSC domain-containing protein [Biomphalaria pfeifferi]
MIPQTIFTTSPVSEKDLGKTLTAKNSFVFSYELIIKNAKLPGHSAYIGCFQMTREWRDDFVTHVPHTIAANVQKCLEECWARRQRFALLKEGQTCCCAVTLRALSVKENSDCTSPCLGDKKQACGAPAHFSIYYTGYIEEPQFTKFSLVFGKKHFVGCYYTSDENTLCPFAFTTQRLRAAMCMGVCEENAYLYAAITRVTRCCCTSTLDQPANQVDKNMCQALCSESDPADMETCGSGSPYHFSVYRTGLFQTVPDYKRPEYDHVWMHPNVNERDIHLL